MPTLRIIQQTLGSNKYQVRLELTLDENYAPLAADADFSFQLSSQDREDIRWYLEDYLQYPFDPAPKIAARIEECLAKIGNELFTKIFEANRQTARLWGKVFDQLNSTRIEIITTVEEATSIPWELLRDPKLQIPLTLRARAFVRSYQQAVQRAIIPQAKAGEPIRILLVICRPKGGQDVPFRSIASRLIKGLKKEARQLFQLDILRPPTFLELTRVLRQAHQQKQPYHVVHFDGHGVYTEEGPSDDQLAKLRSSLTSTILAGSRKGQHGYLLFENPGHQENMQLVDGSTLGQLLVEACVPVLILNACRSAHAEGEWESGRVGEGEGDSRGNPSRLPDVHSKVRAFGSLAQEVMDTGVAGVVAMRYNLYVVTATRWVADVYAALVQGQSLGEAVTLGRKQLASESTREGSYGPLELQDWPVPVVYEAAPIHLFSKPTQSLRFNLQSILGTLQSAAASSPTSANLDSELPYAPDVGFFGRDETLLALDRAFDQQQVVLLHAYAGSGKTTTAAEFARWYSLTGGCQHVLFTSFEYHITLARVLDKLGQMFGPALKQSGVNWLALDDNLRRQVALQLLQQVRLLWIWDNVEQVAGFPTGSKSAWSQAEQQELANFLREAAQNTSAKFLLTSRRDERTWLGDLPARIKVPPMRFTERVELTKAIAAKHNRRLTDWQAWRPLLTFSQGNPLTLTVVVRQALRDKLENKEHINAYVTQLRAGESTFTDDQTEGRSQSLAASLNYGFAHTFTEAERKQLALLHFFQGFVAVHTLQLMGQPDDDWHLPEVRGLTRQAAISLLDRAAEIGLLTALGSRTYRIHPALPWFFKTLFDEYYTSLPSAPIKRGEEGDSPLMEREGRGVRACRAFVEAMGLLGNYYHTQYIQGNRDVIGALSDEEANFLHARQLARQHGWYYRLISTMEGLRWLYDQTGRRAAWQKLVTEIEPDFVDPTTDGPLPGREEEWSLINDYRVRLADEARQWAEALRLQRAGVDWNRQRATDALTLPPEQLDRYQRHIIRGLAVSLEQLGHIQREQGQPTCTASYEEAILLCQCIGDKSEEGIIAFNLGHAYIDILVLRDLEQAEQWYQRSYNLRAKKDNLGRSQSLGQLGYVAYERFLEAHSTLKQAEQLRDLNAAFNYYQQSLALTPPNAVNDLAVAHHQLGQIYKYKDAGDIDRALPHAYKAIRYFEAAGNLYRAGGTRYNVALDLARAGRLLDAREYARAALHNYQTFGERAATDIQKAKSMVTEIERLIRGE